MIWVGDTSVRIPASLVRNRECALLEQQKDLSCFQRQGSQVWHPARLLLLSPFTERNPADDDGASNPKAVEELGDIVIKICQTTTTKKLVPRNYATDHAEVEVHERPKNGMPVAHCTK